MRRQNSWTDPTIIGEHRGTLWFHRPEINSISGNVVIRPFPSHASKFPPRRLTTWLASPGLIRTRPLHPIERNWLHASHPLTIGEAVDRCGVSLPVPLFGSRSFNERPLCARSGHSGKVGFCTIETCLRFQIKKQPSQGGSVSQNLRQRAARVPTAKVTASTALANSTSMPSPGTRQRSPECDRWG